MRVKALSLTELDNFGLSRGVNADLNDAEIKFESIIKDEINLNSYNEYYEDKFQKLITNKKNLTAWIIEFYNSIIVK